MHSGVLFRVQQLLRLFRTVYIEIQGSAGRSRKLYNTLNSGPDYTRLLIFLILHS